eukprot:4597129-Pyramimonas_sp.AAC.1
MVMVACHGGMVVTMPERHGHVRQEVGRAHPPQCAGRRVLGAERDLNLGFVGWLVETEDPHPSPKVPPVEEVVGEVANCIIVGA